MKQKTYYKNLTQVASVLQIPYQSLYKHRHRPEFAKSARGYNIQKISNYLEQQEAIREEEERTQNLLGAEEELLEKQVKLEHTKLKCRLLELQILTKQGNLVDVNTVLETRTKELNRLRKHLIQMVQKLPLELVNEDQNSIRTKLNESVNNMLADLSEFILDDWTEQENELELELENNE